MELKYFTAALRRDYQRIAELFTYLNFKPIKRTTSKLIDKAVFPLQRLEQ